jgi:hypothetical protein
MQDETLIWGKFHKWREVKTRVLLNLSESTEVSNLLEACDLALSKLFIECILDPEYLKNTVRNLREFAKAAVREGKDALKEIGQYTYFLGAGEIFLSQHFGVQKRTVLTEPECATRNGETYLLVHEVLILHRMLIELLKEADGAFNDVGSTGIDRFVRAPLSELQKSATQSETALQGSDHVERLVTTRIYLLDPRLPEEDVQRLRHDLYGKSIHRETFRPLDGDYLSRPDWEEMYEGKKVRLLVYDEIEFFEHFVPEEQRERVKKEWVKIRTEILRKYLKGNPFTRAVWASLDKLAALEYIERELREAESHINAQRYGDAFPKMRKAVDGIFKLMIGESDDYYVDGKTLKDHQNEIEKQYSRDLYYDIVKVRGASSPGAHQIHPDPSRAKELLRRARLVWETFKDGFDVYGIQLPQLM